MTDRPAGEQWLAVPLGDEQNPYQTLLHAALAARGVFVTGGDLWLSSVLRTKADAVVVGWPEFLFMPPAVGWRFSLQAHLAAALAVVGTFVLHLRQIPVVFIYHNQRPHRAGAPRVQTWLIEHFVRTADVVVAHTQWIADRATEVGAPPARVIVAPHGSYVETIGESSAGRTELRRNYGFHSDEFVVLAFGQIRPDKRLLDTLAELTAAHLDGVRLWVVGPPVDTALVEQLAARERAGEPIRVDARVVSEAELPDVFAAADIALLNQQPLFSSGSLIFALSTGLPVVAPRAGSAPEIVRSGAGVLFDGHKRLADAIQEAEAQNREEMAEAALRAAEALDWSAAAKAIMEAVARARTMSRGVAARRHR